MQAALANNAVFYQAQFTQMAQNNTPVIFPFAYNAYQPFVV